MRILASIQELWNYCDYCPVCKENNGQLILTMGPDECITLVKHNKTENNLELNCILNVSTNQYTIDFDIDCNNNTFSFDLSKPKPTSNAIIEASKPGITLCIQKICQKCNYYYVNGSDIELNILTKNAEEIGIERESAYLIHENDQYHITVSYDSQTLFASKFYIMNGNIIDDATPFEYPTSNIEIDFNDAKKVIRKIKTLQTFS